MASRIIDETSITNTQGASGTLVLAGTCLALDQPSGELWTIVWPDKTTTWNADTQTIVMVRPGGRDPVVATVGSRIEFGGLFNASPDFFEWRTEPGPDCPSVYLAVG